MPISEGLTPLDLPGGEVMAGRKPRASTVPLNKIALAFKSQGKKPAAFHSNSGMAFRQGMQTK